MIKFFRQIRRNLISENRFSKYLLYAMGEIVLVVIGILIALNLNIRSENQKKTEKIEGILEDIMEELATDIVVSTDIITDYHIIDSLSNLVLDNKVKREDYANPQNVRLIYLAEAGHTFTTNHNAYDALMNSIGDIPLQFKAVIKSLSFLYEHHLPELEAYNDRISDITNQVHIDHSKEYDWYYQVPYHESDGAINYKINDPKYKNKVRRVWWDGVRTHRRTICQFRILAIDSYKLIAKILNKSIDTVAFLPKKELLESYVGNYLDEEENVFELLIDDDHLIMINTNDRSEKQLYSLTDSNFFVLEGGIVKFEEGVSANEKAFSYLNGYRSRPFNKLF